MFTTDLCCVCVCLLLQSFNNFGHLRKSATFFPILTEGERKLNLKHSVSSSMSTCLNLIMGPEISDLSLSQFWTFIWEVEVGVFSADLWIYSFVLFFVSMQLFSVSMPFDVCFKPDRKWLMCPDGVTLVLSFFK